MFLNENFAILEEDEDIDVLEEDILMEGSVELLDEAMSNKIIIKPSDIDKAASRKAVQKMKDKVGSMLASGNYREFKSSDKALLASALKTKEFWTFLGYGSNVVAQLRWSVFKYEGLTLVSFYFPANKAQAGGIGARKQMVYAILVKDNGVSAKNKVVLRKLTLKALPENTSDRIDM